MMKRLLLIVALCCVVSIQMVQAQEEVKVLYMSVVRSTGQEVAAPLYDLDEFNGPKIDFMNNRLLMDGRSMLLSRISEIRFSIKTEIRDCVESVDVESVTENNVYSIDGRLIRENAASLSGLPKGIYIMNGKKLCITK